MALGECRRGLCELNQKWGEAKEVMANLIEEKMHELSFKKQIDSTWINFKNIMLHEIISFK